MHHRSNHPQGNQDEREKALGHYGDKANYLKDEERRWIEHLRKRETSCLVLFELIDVHSQTIFPRRIRSRRQGGIEPSARFTRVILSEMERPHADDEPQFASRDQAVVHLLESAAFVAAFALWAFQAVWFRVADPGPGWSVFDYAVIGGFGGWLAAAVWSRRIGNGWARMNAAASQRGVPAYRRLPFFAKTAMRSLGWGDRRASRTAISGYAVLVSSLILLLADTVYEVVSLPPP